MSQKGTVRTEVTIPHLAETLVSATVGKWLKQPGDYINQYDVICELYTDKVNTEMPCPIEGTLLEILAVEGQEAAIGEAICIILEKVSGEPSSVTDKHPITDSPAAPNAVSVETAGADHSMRSRL